MSLKFFAFFIFSVLISLSSNSRIKRQSYYDYLARIRPTVPYSRPDYPAMPVPSSTFPPPFGWYAPRQPFQVRTLTLCSLHHHKSRSIIQTHPPFTFMETMV